MKEIKAVIQPHMLQRVLEALHRLPHFPGATISDCRGQGRGGGQGDAPPAEQTLGLSDKVKLEIFCDNGYASELVHVIRQAAHTGRPGDGIIMIADLPRVVRIRTGEEQDEAV